MRAMKAVYGLWANIQIGQLNKLLKPFGCRLVKKTSKDWGNAVSITAHELEAGAPKAGAPKRPLTVSTAGIVSAGQLVTATSCLHEFAHVGDAGQVLCKLCGAEKISTPPPVIT